MTPRPPVTLRPDLDAAPRKIHPCGCVTVFDVVAWQSVILTTCALHTAQRPR